jgi:hypothetical protein
VATLLTGKHGIATDALGAIRTKGDQQKSKISFCPPTFPILTTTNARGGGDADRKACHRCRHALWHTRASVAQCAPLR